ncbi:MAG: hypothetical protein Q7S53_01915 [bacterium]|nr:hypothetical protein [bacterium]
MDTLDKINIQGQEYPVSILQKMDRDALYLGAILNNLLSLEYKLRDYVNLREIISIKDSNERTKVARAYFLGPRKFKNLKDGEYTDLKEGEIIENLSVLETFGKIVSKFNCYKTIITPEELSMAKKLRNDLAHGRISIADITKLPPGTDLDNSEFELFKSDAILKETIKLEEIPQKYQKMAREIEDSIEREEWDKLYKKRKNLYLNGYLIEKRGDEILVLKIEEQEKLVTRIKLTDDELKRMLKDLSTIYKKIEKLIEPLEEKLVKELELDDINF